jgi:hypothetical protein
MKLITHNSRLRRSFSGQVKLKIISGQMIIEAMIGMGIVIVGLLGVLALVSRSTSLNRVISSQLTGNYLAVEGIEIVKNIIDTNIISGNPWNTGLDNSGNFEVDFKSESLSMDQDRYILFDPATNLYGYSENVENGLPTSFKRTVVITPIGSDEIRVNSIVKWVGRGSANFEVNLEDHFFNWMQ